MIANPTLRKSFLLAAVLLSLAAAAPSQAQCLGTSTLGIFYMDLRFGITATVGAPVTVLAPPVVNPACADMSMMAVVQIDIPAACSQATAAAGRRARPSLPAKT